MFLPVPASAPTAVVHDLEIDDDRNLIQPGDPVLLIIEDDATFARILADLAHQRGIRTLVALRGSAALPLAREFNPGAITLDINLPDMAGWTLLDRLKQDPVTRHIPVHAITGDDNRRLGLALGAMTYLEKSITKDRLNAAFDTIHRSMQPRIKKLLLVTSSHARETEWRELLGGTDVEILAVSSGGEALAVAGQQYVDCVVIDLQLVGVQATQLAEEIQAQTDPYRTPVVFFGKRTRDAGLEVEIQTLARMALVRRADSPGQLLLEAVLLLHRCETDLSESQKAVLQAVRRNDSTLANKKVLVVDDDVRNIFALTTVLEQHNLQVVHAENGRAGIETLLRTPKIDAVLMDIMMPEMDGYETMKAIRQIPELHSLPIIAVTAKAMKGDRAKCIEAGASDYITKPVDLDQLFSVLRVWLASNQEFRQTVTVTG
jgi:hypothetical protein